MYIISHVSSSAKCANASYPLQIIPTHAIRCALTAGPMVPDVTITAEAEVE